MLSKPSHQESEPRYAEVAPAVPMPGSGKQTYTYSVPVLLRQSLGLFSQVAISLGKRTVKGFVVELHNRKLPFATKALRASQGVQLTAYQVDFARWMAATMHGGLGYTLRLFVPPRRLPVASGAILPRGQATSTTPLELGLISAKVTKRRQELTKLLRLVVKRNQQVLVLVPEMWMVDEVLSQLQQMKIVCAPMHSGLTPKQVTAIWQQVQLGEVDIIVGTQKALFLPYQWLGAVVIEEEFYASHKLWDAYPRLDGRMAARQLAFIHHAAIIYSSSMASPELAYRLQQRLVTALINSPLLPEARLVAASFNDKQQRSPIPSEALRLLHQWVQAGERVLLMQPQHDIQVRRLLHQHFGKNLQKIDAQTKIIDRKKKLWAGTTASLRLVGSGQVDRVLMLFPEKILGYPDYRSEEQVILLLARLYQILSAGRKIVIATRAPQLVAEKVLAPLTDGFSALLSERKQLGLPPFFDMVRLTVAARTTKSALSRAKIIRDQIESEKKDNVQIYGPFTTKEPVRGDQFQVHLLMVGQLASLQPLYLHTAIAAADAAPQRII